MNNDLISRSALKEAFKAWKNMDDYYHNTDCNDIPLSEAFDLIDNAPTFNLDDFYGKAFRNGEENALKIREIPQGEWITVTDKYGDNVKCPFCGKEIAGTDLNFCVKCGAEMKGGAE